MLGKIVIGVNSIIGWWYVYMHATQQFIYIDNDRWIPYLIIGGFSIMLAALGASCVKDRD